MNANREYRRWSGRWMIGLWILGVVGCSGGASNTMEEEEGPILSFATDATEVAPVPLSRAEKVDAGKLKTEGNVFSVYAVYSLGVQENPVFDAQPQDVTYKEAETAWTYSPVKQWVNSGHYKFRAYFPGGASGAKVDKTNSNSDVLSLSYSPFDSEDPDQFDLLVAYAERKPAEEGYGSVLLTFRHALAAVKFEIMYGTHVAAGTTDQLKECYLQGTDLGIAGNLTYSGTDGIAWKHTNGGETEKYYHWNGNETIGVGETNAAVPYDGDGIIFVIPQQALSNTWFYFFTEEGQKWYQVKFPPVLWEAGKIYTYTIVLDYSDVTMTVSVKDWEPVQSNIDIYI